LGKIDKQIFDQRMDRANGRFQEAMEKSAQDMQMIIDNHRGNLTRTLKSDI
jgi:hypothetical protein